MENPQQISQDTPCQQKYDSDRKFVIFDLDGTLIDSFECVLRCVNLTLIKIGYIPLKIIDKDDGDIGDIFKRVSNQYPYINMVSFKNTFDHIHLNDIVINLNDKCTRRLLNYWQTKILLVIITNKHQRIAERICQEFFSKYHFTIIGRMNCLEIKSNSDYIRNRLREHNLSLNDCLCYYGDSETDEQLAKMLNIPFKKV